MKETPSTVCPFCGAPLTIEGDYCPNCGSKKTQFTEHRQKMKAYNKAFEETKEGVVAENKKFSKNAALIAIAAVLVAVILGEFIAYRNAYTIARKMAANRARANKPAVLSMLKDYEAKDEYLGITTMWDENALRYLSEEPGFKEYDLVKGMCYSYGNVIQSLESMLRTENYYEKGSDEYINLIDQRAGYVGDYYEDYLKRYKSYISGYDPTAKYNTYVAESYKEEHMAAYEKQKENLRALVSYYFDIPYEEMDAFDAMTNVKKNALLCEKAEAKYGEE